MLLGVILSDVPNRDSLSSLQNGYIIFTSVVSGCSLIILFQLYALKVYTLQLTFTDLRCVGESVSRVLVYIYMVAQQCIYTTTHDFVAQLVERRIIFAGSCSVLIKGLG